MAETESETVQSKPKIRVWVIVTGVCLVLAASVLAWRIMAGRWTPPGLSRATESVQAQAKVRSTLDLDPFLVNLADTENARFLKVTFRLGVEDKELAQQLSADPVALAATRDTIISLLSSKTADQVLTPVGKDQLRQEVRKRVNSILPKGSIGEVYIVDFVVQM